MFIKILLRIKELWQVKTIMVIYTFFILAYYSAGWTTIFSLFCSSLSLYLSPSLLVVALRDCDYRVPGESELALLRTPSSPSTPPPPTAEIGWWHEPQSLQDRQVPREASCWGRRRRVDKCCCTPPQSWRCEDTHRHTHHRAFWVHFTLGSLNCRVQIVFNYLPLKYAKKTIFLRFLSLWIL